VKFGLNEETIEKIQAVLSRVPEVDKAVLYGSRAKGNFKNGSDIDLTLYGGGLNLDILDKVAIGVDDLLLPYEVDLSIFDHITDPDLIEHIARVGVVFYTKGRLREK